MISSILRVFSQPSCPSKHIDFIKLILLVRLLMYVIELNKHLINFRYSNLVGGLEYLLFSIIFLIYGLSSFPLTNIFQRGWNHQPVSVLWITFRRSRWPTSRMNIFCFRFPRGAGRGPAAISNLKKPAWFWANFVSCK
jgi:hypothetical protein